jgi:hypothetical protein
MVWYGMSRKGDAGGFVDVVLECFVMHASDERKEEKGGYDQCLKYLV